MIDGAIFATVPSSGAIHVFFRRVIMDERDLGKTQNPSAY
jgi:hypothetical protein